MPLVAHCVWVNWLYWTLKHSPWIRIATVLHTICFIALFARGSQFLNGIPMCSVHVSACILFWYKTYRNDNDAVEKKYRLKFESVLNLVAQCASRLLFNLVYSCDGVCLIPILITEGYSTICLLRSLSLSVPPTQIRLFTCCCCLIFILRFHIRSAYISAVRFSVVTWKQSTIDVKTVLERG